MSRFVALLVALVVLVGSISVAAVLRASSSVAGPSSYDFCPAAKRLIGETTHWHRHQLAPGVSLAEARAGTDSQPINVQVVRVDLANPRTAVAPLHHTLTTRHRLSRMAARPHLVAATNAMYFNVAIGAPTVPFIGPRGPIVLSRYHANVAGISTHGRGQDGQVWLLGHVTSGDERHRIGAINEIRPPRGLSIYTPTWGAAKIPLPLLAQSRAVRGSRLVGPIGRRRVVPHNGKLLVATNSTAVRWLAALPRSREVSVTYHAKTTAPHAFAQGYGVGTQVVATPNHIRTGLYCRRSEIYAARTDIAWSHHRRQLILATVESPRGSEHAGVDENQMSQIMVRLGAERSYALDGGGSTELVARLRGQHKLSVRSWRHGYRERAIPIGIGVYSVPKPKVSKHATHKKRHKPKKPKGPLGGLLPLTHR